jgi:hypothetical protein
VGGGKAASQGPGCTEPERLRRRRKLGGSRFGGEKGQSPSAPLIAASAAKERVRDGSRMAETPLYRRLGAKPESPAPKGRRPHPHSDKGMIERVIFRSYRFGNLAAISFNI